MRKSLNASLLTILWMLSVVAVTQAKWKPWWGDYIAKGNKQRITDRIELGKLEQSGIKILEGFSGKPSPNGILKRYLLVLPPFSRGCYFSGDHHSGVEWPDGANRIQPWIFDSLKELGSENYVRRPSNHPRVREGMFLLLKLRDGRYLAITPIAGPLTMTWLYISENGRLVLNFGTLGTAPVSCDAPIFAWSYSDDVYTACRQAWAKAIMCKPLAGSTDFRRNKQFPEVFKYLGWCSWENYWWKIDEKVLTDVVNKIEESKLPIRYLLVDDGHLDAGEDRKLRSFNPNPEKFPNGWDPLLKLRKEDKIKWMGLWNTTSGYWDTISPENNFGEELNKHLVSIERNRAYVPRNSSESANAFYDAHLGAVKQHGFDFVKVDCQARNICWYLGTDNAVEATNHNLQALELAVKKHTGGIINCMAHSLPCTFNTRYSAVIRCSIDYRVGKIARGKSHLLQSYHNTPWLGQTVWLDHDMFHSSDPAAGRMMAISKAVSGGPVYLSDDPTKFVADFIRPLAYEDGFLLRPIAPAGPLADSIFVDPMRERISYRIIAPLRGGAATVVCYNLFEPTLSEPIGSFVRTEDYIQASAMIQPYPGKWKVPQEGLVVFDWYDQKAWRLEGQYSFELNGFSDRLLHLCPIRDGWAVIGRTDKYLCPAAVEVISSKPGKLKIRLAESGPLGIWLADGIPSAKGVKFENHGKGFWEADIKTGQKDMILTIWKIGTDRS